MTTRLLAFVATAAFASATVTSTAEPVAVRFAEGLVHGFLTLRTLDGSLIANGDLIQSARGSRVTSRLVFRFKDGSLLDETAVFSQQGHFRLITDHLVQKGPAFSKPLEMSIDRNSGRVVVRYSDEDGHPKVEDERMELPDDLANGLVLTLLKNVRPEALPPSVSMIAPTPKPRLVKLAITSAGRERFSTGTTGRSATHYVVKIEIGGLAGLVAPLLGKQPADSHVWILGGDAPAFVKFEGPLALGAPPWRIELASPVWNAGQTAPDGAGPTRPPARR
jgi:hypothetical protein